MNSWKRYDEDKDTGKPASTPHPTKTEQTLEEEKDDDDDNEEKESETLGVDVKNVDEGVAERINIKQRKREIERVLNNAI